MVSYGWLKGKTMHHHSLLLLVLIAGIVVLVFSIGFQSNSSK